MNELSYADVFDRYRHGYQWQLFAQSIRPFVIPLDISNYLVLISFLACSSLVRSFLRSPVFLPMFLISATTIQEARTLRLAYGVLPGILASWCIVVPMNLMFLTDHAEDFSRLVEAKCEYDRDICYVVADASERASKVLLDRRPSWKSTQTSLVV